jgi:hypothetical protein
MTYNGKDGWITGIFSRQREDGSLVEIPQGYESAHPARAEQCPRVQSDGTVAVEDTGTQIRPEPAEAKDNILDVLETEWGLSLDEISTLRSKYALLFDFIEAENFQRAEGMIELIARKERWNNNEKQDILDAIQ